MSSAKTCGVISAFARQSSGRRLRSQHSGPGFRRNMRSGGIGDAEALPHGLGELGMGGDAPDMADAPDEGLERI